MATTVWCIPCGADGHNVAATVDVDGDPMCHACADYLQRELARGGNPPLPQRALAAPKLEGPREPESAQCPHGCGKQKHRGLCAEGRKARGPISAPMLKERGILPAVATVCGVPENASRETREALGELARSASAACNAFRVVKRSEIPGVKRRESHHMNQRVFDAMLAARPEAVEVPIASWKTGVNLRRRLQLIARAQGLEIDWSRTPDSKLFYFWVLAARAHAPTAQSRAEVTR